MAGSKVLVTGYTGLLGNTLSRVLTQEGNQVFGLVRHLVPINRVESICLDLTRKEEVQRAVIEIKPLIVFHTAALTDVDYCEEHPKEAYLLNAETTGILADICRKLDIFFVYISTDFVFDGKKGNYNEEDKPCPLNIYGQTKLEGEKMVIESGANFLIARTSLYGWNILSKQSLAEAVINKLRANTVFTPFADQYFSPLYTRCLAELLINLWRNNYQGIYHLSSDERISKYEFSRKVAEVFGLNSDLLKPINSDKVNFKAPRPKDVSLNNQKAKKKLDLKTINVIDNLRMMKNDQNIYS